jgi:prepilin-type N-terminal cleavage/methylation domain-containing protein
MKFISRSSAGFTLLEVLMALVIAAGTIGALAGLFSVGINTADKAARYAEATTLAQSKLSEILAEVELEEGGKAGEFEDSQYRWSATIAPVPDPVPPEGNAPPQQFFRVQMVEVTVVVTWEVESSRLSGEASALPNVTLSTIRVSGKKQS